MSQREDILTHLQRHGSITQREAIANFGCFRLAARIDELKDSGEPIRTEMVTGLGGKRYARYVYEEEPLGVA